MSKDLSRRLFHSPSDDHPRSDLHISGSSAQIPSRVDPPSEAELTPPPIRGESEQPSFRVEPPVLREYITGTENGPLPPQAEEYRRRHNERALVAEKQRDAWKPLIDDIITAADAEIDRRFGQEPFKKKGRKASELKKKLPPDDFRAILRWERNHLPTGEWTNRFTSYIGCLARRGDYVNPFFEPEQLPFHSLERVYRDCWRYFNIEDNPVAWDFLFGYDGKFKHALREWRHEIKKKTLAFEEDWERFYKRDKRINKEDLAALMILWRQEKHKAKCKINKENRDAKEYDHHTGSTSFAQIIDQHCRMTNSSFMPLPELHRKTFASVKDGYASDEKKRQKLQLINEMQEALDNTYAEIISQSQEAPSVEENYKVSQIVYGLPKKGRTRWLGVGAQKVSLLSQSSMSTTPSSIPAMTSSYMLHEDCTQQAMQLVSSAMGHLDGQIPEEVWEDIMEECMKVVHPTASLGMVSTHIMICCKRKIPTRLQTSLMVFLASKKAFTSGGQTSGHASVQCVDDVVGSTTRRSRNSGENDEEMNEEEDQN